MRNLFKRGLVVQVLVLTMLLLSSITYSKIITPKGEAISLKASDVAPKDWKSKYYNEFWTYKFYLNNNININLNYSRMNFGSVKDPVCGADLLISGLDNETYSMAREYPVKNFIYNATTNKLNIHPTIYFEGGLPNSHKVHFESTKKGQTYIVDLKFSQIASSQVIGDGQFEIGDKKMGIMINIPYSKVKGTISINGKITEVEGTAVMDHVWSDDTSPTMAKRGYRYLRFFKGGYETAYIIETNEDDGIVGYAINRKDGVTKIIQPKSITNVKAKSRYGVGDWRNGMSINYDDGSVVNVNYKTFYQKFAVLGQFSGVTKWAVKKFMGGNVVNYRGWALFDNNTSGFYDNMYIKK